jgi:hypothetical protein
MEKEFVPYTEALALKELGFNEPCFGVYYTKDGDVRKCGSNEIGDAPLYQQAFRFFREKYNMVGEINSYYSDKKWSFNYDIVTIYKEKASDRFNTYEEAELECLLKLIEIVKEK